MSAIVPPPSTPPPTPAPVVAPTVIVAAPPPALAQLPPGSVVEAKILDASPAGILKLQTNLGVFDIKTAIPFPKDASLELLLLKNSPLTQFQINAVNGKAIVSLGAIPNTSPENSQTSKAQVLTKPGGNTPPSGRLPTAHADPLAARAANAETANLVNFDIKTQIKAIVINTGADSAGAKGQSQAISATPPTTGAPDALNQSTQGANSTARPQSTQTTSAQNNPSGPKAQLEPGSQIIIRISSVTPSHEQRQGAQRGQSAGQNHNPPSSAISGTVSAITANGQPLVQTPLGLLSLAIDRPPPIGSTMQFEVIQSALKPALQTAFNYFPDIIAQSGKWPHLEEAFSHLSQSAPGVAEEVLNSSVPRANSQLLTNVLFFLNALRGGDFNSWLGKAAATILGNERIDLSNQLSEEFSHIARVFNEAPQADWRTAIVPFFDGSALEQVQMHMRGKSAKDQNQGDEEPSRFIIDVNLSELGRIQLDGFIKSRGKRFDMIVRSEIPFLKQMKRDISRIFSDFSEATGVAGTIAFQTTVKFIDIPIPKLEEQNGKGIVI